MTNLQPIMQEPALFIDSSKTLVIADLHIGIERELREMGLHIPSQTHLLLQHLDRLCSSYRPKHIILLGDVKHNIPSSTIAERRDVRTVVEHLQSWGTLHVLPGNHDGNIHKLLPKETQIYSSDGMIQDTIGFLHGHRWPKTELFECETILLAHTHPTIMLQDRLGVETYESCWLRGHVLEEKTVKRYPSHKNPEIIVMPAFNPLCGGVAANKDTLLGPVCKQLLDVDHARVFLLDGSSLGKVKDISLSR